MVIQELMVLEYDHESGHLGNHELCKLFDDGWETLEPVKYYHCCEIYRTILYK